MLQRSKCEQPYEIIGLAGAPFAHAKMRREGAFALRTLGLPAPRPAG